MTDYERNETLANDIFNWLVDNELWVDICIYFNGKCWSTSDKYNKEFCYYERRYFEYEADPREYFDYVNRNHILSMSFEGDLYYVLNGYTYGWVELENEFRKLFDKYNLWFELGNAWNLTAYSLVFNI